MSDRAEGAGKYQRKANLRVAFSRPTLLKTRPLVGMSQMTLCLDPHRSSRHFMSHVPLRELDAFLLRVHFVSFRCIRRKLVSLSTLRGFHESE